jgi:hypothetical protein
MASNDLTEFCSYPIISERVTNLNIQHADLVHCPVCGYILWKPVTCSLCENSFCFQCIQKWLFEQQEQIIENDNQIKSLSLIRCPFNCSPYKQRKCPPLLISILSKLTIECQNKLYGCQQILLYEQLEKHQEEFCQYKIVQCPGCKQNIFKESFDKDQHLLKCIYIEVECLKCQSVFKRKDKHNQSDCNQKQICLLRHDMFIFQQKFSKVLDIQRKRVEICDQKMNIIEEIWGNDDDDNEQTEKKINLVPTSAQLLSLQSMEKYRIIIGLQLILILLFTLLIYIRIFFN